MLPVLLSLPRVAVLAAAAPSLVATSALLAEEDTGKTLYALNPDARMYPASMTKIVTALVVMDYLKLDDIVTIGDEIDATPAGSSLARHQKGERITVMNLLRGLIMRSGNDSGCILAMDAAKKASGNGDISYPQAEKYFSGLMNDKAKALGATGTNFTNPHGFHDPNHYTTASDMFLFSREFMKNPILAGIARETEYKGNSLGTGTAADYTFLTQDYDWVTINELLIPGANYYQFATGLKTGSTDEAGDCLTSSAEKGGIRLISVVFHSTVDGRYADSIALLNYGFDNFRNETVQTSGEVVDTLEIDNPMLGAATEMDTLTNSGFTGFYSRDELAAMVRKVEYGKNAVKDGKIVPPVEKGDVIGTVTYTLNGKAEFTGDVIAGDSAGARSLNTDVTYYKDRFISNIFSLSALPYWICAVLAVIIVIILLSSRRRKRDRSYYRLNRRY
ncbi:MAG: D-alanyl-D-alanine carboxypeptidase [Firmicutes bacterium]|nr:D-alanyl-D-alanine carboxypeptidase [Bacillota bacterium]